MCLIDVHLFQFFCYLFTRFIMNAHLSNVFWLYKHGVKNVYFQSYKLLKTQKCDVFFFLSQVKNVSILGYQKVNARNAKYLISLCLYNFFNTIHNKNARWSTYISKILGKLVKLSSLPQRFRKNSNHQNEIGFAQVRGVWKFDKNLWKL